MIAHSVCGSFPDAASSLRASVCVHTPGAAPGSEGVPAWAALVLPLRSDVQPIPWLRSAHKESAYVCGGGGEEGDSRLLLLLPAFH